MSRKKKVITEEKSEGNTKTLPWCQVDTFLTFQLQKMKYFQTYKGLQREYKKKQIETWKMSTEKWS